MRVSAKGQVTIPAAIRKRGGLHPGTAVRIDFDGDVVTVRPVRRRIGKGRGARLVAHLRGRGDVLVSSDEVMAPTRGD